jgi:maltose/moltooligosaccharide transporter
MLHLRGIIGSQIFYFKWLRMQPDNRDKRIWIPIDATCLRFWFITYNAIEAFFTLYAKNHLSLPGEDGARLLGQFALTLVPRATLVIRLTSLPILGTVPVLGVILMVGGASWAMVNVNSLPMSLPMVVDMTDDLRVGTYTGLYYFFATLSAIVGPNVNGWIVQLSGRNYNAIMMAAPLFMIVALIMMLGVRKGEAKPSSSPATGV